MAQRFTDPLKSFDIAADEISNDIQELYSSQYTEKIVTLTPAQILTVGTEYFQLLTNPGAGKYYDIDKMIFEFVYESGFGYNDMAGDYFEIRYSDGMSEKVLARIDGDLIAGATSKVAVVKEFSSAITLNLEPAKIVNSYLLNKEIYLGTYNYQDLTENSQTAYLRIKIYYKELTIGE